MLPIVLIAQVLAAPLALPPVPFVPEPPEPPEAIATAENAEYDRVLQYRREELSVRPVVRQLWSTPMPVPTDIQRPLRSEVWGPSPGGETDWGIVRGSVQVLDDLDLADLLDDQAMRAAIEQKRFWPHLAWTGTFSAIGAGAIGTGIWLTWFNGQPRATPGNGSLRDPQRDPVAIGTSLLVTGVVSLAVGILYPAMAPPRHVLSPLEAQAACDRHNDRLRHGLELAPRQIL